MWKFDVIFDKFNINYSKFVLMAIINKTDSQVLELLIKMEPSTTSCSQKFSL
jgi:hypothetical protein